ncbi:putative acetyltransferase [Crossiella equi]|uniref:Acetyltransferase n=1 Tax=Crossiella equi TaxID=130796 RepID=A0ABS5A7X0_9PSEU|nr:GNAT family N-acetyltransferase [Crossiella equi]MBP2472687.1 putative acetyltransferase [Crossiella equi]
MAEHEVRVLGEDELHEANTVFRGSILKPPMSDSQWEIVRSFYPPGRTLGVRSGKELVGTALSLLTPMTVPGARGVPHAAVTGVGVRADHARRGVASALMRAQLTAAAEEGLCLASLRASEAVIYGRFGYGVATRGRKLEVRRERASLRPEAPRTGQVRQVAAAELEAVVESVYRRTRADRPGWLERDRHYWALARMYAHLGQENLWAAVHTGPDGDDGYVLYTLNPQGPVLGRKLEVEDLHWGNPGALAGLWRYLLGIDLVTHVLADLMPLDLPLELLLTDRAAASTTAVKDETWLRLTDVGAALAARSYGPGEPVVLGVRDAFLPANTGNYRIGPDGAERTSAEAQLSLDVDTLAMLYLGNQSPSALAAAGLVSVHDPAALARADRLCQVPEVPWSGSYF